MKNLTILASLMLAMLLFGNTSMAQAPSASEDKTPKMTSKAPDNCCGKNCANFVDKNNDGICDNKGKGTGKGANFVDKNGDGVCDRHEHKRKNGNGNCGMGMGHQHRGGNCPNKAKTN